MTRSPAANQPTLTSLALACLPHLTLLGFAGLAANIAVSFEELHGGMLWISAALLAAAPVGMALHLGLTDELTAEEKRRWLAALMSRRGPELFGAYFSPAARRRATERLTLHQNGPATGAS